VQKILQIAKRKRETNVHYYGQADDLWARLGVTKGGTFCLPATLIARPARLMRIPEHPATHSDHIRPPVPTHSATCDALP
jgi:hypothetical protein